MKSLINKVDAIMVRVPSLDEGLAFYERGLGHRLLWRMADSCGLAMDGSETELVLSTRLGPETDLKVDSASDAADQFVSHGGTIVSGPDDIMIGKVVVVRDPFGNELVLLDSSKGSLVTNDQGYVTGVTDRT